MNQLDPRNIFHDIDRHRNSGVISQFELAQYLRKKELSDLEVDEAFNFMELPEEDIGMRELCKSWRKLPVFTNCMGLSNKKMVEIFHELDVEKLYSISVMEFVNYLLNVNYTPQKIESILNQLSEFGEYLKFSEYFLKLMVWKPFVNQEKKQSPNRREHQLVGDEACKLFLDIDRNDDGRISKFELERYMQLNKYQSNKVKHLLERIELLEEDILYEDFCQATKAYQVEEEIKLFRKIDPEDLFREIDDKETGYISKIQIAEYLYYNKYSEEEIQEILYALRLLKSDFSYATYQRILQLDFKIKIENQLKNMTILQPEENIKPTEVIPIGRYEQVHYDNDTYISKEDLEIDPIEIFYEIDEKNTGKITVTQLKDLLMKRQFSKTEIQRLADLFSNKEIISFDKYCSVMDYQTSHYKFPSKHGEDMQIMNSSLRDFHLEWRVCNIIRRSCNQTEGKSHTELAKTIKRSLDRELKAGQVWHCLITKGQYWGYYSHIAGANLIVKHKAMIFTMFATPY